MKHFVTLAALLTSLSVFAQLPYNPDSNNDGHIGVIDLTSLLSVYSNSFSNGFLGSGTMMAEHSYIGIDTYFCQSDDDQPITSWVVDGNIEFAAGWPSFAVLVDPVVNGTTIHLLLPEEGYYQFSVYATTIDETIIEGETNVLWDESMESNSTWNPRIWKMVWWDGKWHSDFTHASW